MVHEWSITQLKELAEDRGWILDQKPDPERGLYVRDSEGMASLRLTLPGGAQIVAQSGGGLLRCLPKMNEALHELGIGPRSPEVKLNQYEHGGAGAPWPR